MFRVLSRRCPGRLPVRALPSRAARPYILHRHSSTSATTTTTTPRSNDDVPPQGQIPPKDDDDLPWYYPRWRRVLVSLVLAIKFLAFTHLVVSKIFIISQCEGPSMLPTLPTSGSVIVNNLYSRGRGIKVGDLIAAHRPDDMDVMLLKRVIGMPGDYIVVDPMAEGRGEETMMVRVPEGHCWIAGDNLSHSIDSRFYGPVPLGLVMGKVIAQVAGGRRWFTDGPFTRVAKGE